MVCYNVEHKEFRILCEYMCQRGQQGMKRCERVSGLDLGRSSFSAILPLGGPKKQVSHVPAWSAKRMTLTSRAWLVCLLPGHVNSHRKRREVSRQICGS